MFPFHTKFRYTLHCILLRRQSSITKSLNTNNALAQLSDKLLPSKVENEPTTVKLATSKLAQVLCKEAVVKSNELDKDVEQLNKKRNLNYNEEIKAYIDVCLKSRENLVILKSFNFKLNSMLSIYFFLFY